MTYTEWIEYVEKIRLQYFEGAITPRDYFNAIIYQACEVKQTDNDDALTELDNV